MAVLSGPSLRTPPLPRPSDAEGARFFQKSEWLMCPVRYLSATNALQESDCAAELTTTVELERGLEGNALLRGRGLCVRLLSSVERSHVGLVVLLVVKLHDLARDEWLERIVSVGEVGELVLSGHRAGVLSAAAGSVVVVGG